MSDPEFAQEEWSPPEQATYDGIMKPDEQPRGGDEPRRGNKKWWCMGGLLVVLVVIVVAVSVTVSNDNKSSEAATSTKQPPVVQQRPEQDDTRPDDVTLPKKWTQLGADLIGQAGNDRFGNSVALSADGAVVAVGAKIHEEKAGQVTVYAWQHEIKKWQQIGQVLEGTEIGDGFGVAVKLSENGNILAVGGYMKNAKDESLEDAGHVRVFEFDGSDWNPLGQELFGEGPEDEFGRALDLSDDGTILAVGGWKNDNAAGTDAGLVQVFQFDRFLNAWNSMGQDLIGEGQGDEFGGSVALSANGSILAVGSWKNDGENGIDSGHVRLYEFNGSEWKQLGTDLDGTSGGLATKDHFGNSVALSADGLIVAAGGSYRTTSSGGASSGHVRVHLFDRDSGTFQQLGQDLEGLGEKDFFGRTVALSADGTILAASGPWHDGTARRSGHVRLFEYDGSNWNALGKNINGQDTEDLFGWSVALSADGMTVAAGATLSDGSNGNDSGHVGVFQWFD